MSYGERRNSLGGIIPLYIDGVVTQVCIGYYPRLFFPLALWCLGYPDHLCNSHGCGKFVDAADFRIG